MTRATNLSGWSWKKTTVPFKKELTGRVTVVKPTSEKLVVPGRNDPGKKLTARWVIKLPRLFPGADVNHFFVTNETVTLYKKTNNPARVTNDPSDAHQFKSAYTSG
jgi:hypothetical protein